MEDFFSGRNVTRPNYVRNTKSIPNSRLESMIGNLDEAMEDMIEIVGDRRELKTQSSQISEPSIQFDESDNDHEDELDEHEGILEQLGTATDSVLRLECLDQEKE